MATAAPTAQHGRAHSPAPARLHLARFARASLQGLISEADMAAVLAAAGKVLTDATVIYGSAR
jgi:hypothetical protein